MTPQESIKQSLYASYKNLEESPLDNLSKEIIFAPCTRKIDIKGQKISASDLRYQVASRLENLKSAPASDFNLMLASSIETLSAETNSEQEYFRWLEDCSEIIKNMNDGYISEDDLKERNGFLEMSHQRESELMLCLGLYASSANPKAVERASGLRYKLQKLREMRSAIEEHTRNEANTKISKAEYETALPYYKLFKSLSRLPFGDETLSAEPFYVNISHASDTDLQADYNYNERLLNDVLDIEEQTNQRTLEKQKEEISDKLKELAGRRKTFRLSYIILKEKQMHLHN